MSRSIQHILTDAMKRGWQVDVMDYSLAGEGRVAFIANLAGTKAFVFYKPWSGHFFGLLDNGTQFQSTDVGLKGKFWFETLCNFFGVNV